MGSRFPLRQERRGFDHNRKTLPLFGPVSIARIFVAELGPRWRGHQLDLGPRPFSRKHDAGYPFRLIRGFNVPKLTNPGGSGLPLGAG